MGRFRGVDAPEIDLDAYVASLTPSRARDASRAGASASRDAVRVARWLENEKVLLLTFRDAATQRRALGRLSMFVEDPEWRGKVAGALPSGARGGVANYSGHNARAREVCAFYAAARREGGCWEDEEAVVEALVRCGALRRNKDGAVEVSESAMGRGEWCECDGEGEDGEDGDEENVVPETCVIAVCASGDAREVQDALLHEAMHGLWYARENYASWCYEFYRGDALGDEERAIWVDFLRELRYDVSVREVVVNEFQAYMATERVLFGGDGATANKGKKSGGAFVRAADALAAMQKKFAAAARDAVPDPPRCGQLTVVWE